ncbi:MAG: hypothetical protein LBB65_07180 [Burkholderiales bacterium]|nr:hypothetical protein [Burkholderiales bacterium]
MPIECEAASINGELSRYSNAISQLINDTVAVIIVARSPRDPRGQEALTEIETLRANVMNAMIGWLPPGAAAEFLYRRGRIEQFNDQTVFWRDEFLTYHDLEK